MIPPELTRSVGSLIKNYPQASAGLTAYVLSWVLYGVIGKRALGAEDDYWNTIRRVVLPVLDSLAAKTPGLYAEGKNFERELYAVAGIELDELERELARNDFCRNPVASLKTNPEGWTEDASWARRYDSPRWVGTKIRRWAEGLGIAGYPAAILGRFVQSLGDVTAFRQVHVTLYRDRDAPEERTYIYVHDEANALNPLTAWSHYLARGQSAERGKTRLTEWLPVELLVEIRDPTEGRNG